MQNYSYSPVDEATQQIRYATLFPGETLDRVEISLTHLSLHSYQKVTTKPDFGTARSLLPDGWNVYLTIEERLLYWNGAAGKSCWEHPNPAFVATPYPIHTINPARLPFEALSYVWGRPGNQQDVFVKDAAVYKRLEVGESLHEALVNLRHKSQPRNLWIDAICINQADFNERAQQVARMSQIYNYCQRVIVWLGPSTDESNHAMINLQHIGDQLELFRGATMLPSPGATRQWWNRQHQLPYSPLSLAQIDRLLARPWFTRLWIRQEIQLANEDSIFICGSTTLTWYALRRALNCLEFNNSVPVRSLIARMLDDLSLFGSNWQGCSFRKVLDFARKSKCSDPRDLVYGVQALIEPEIAANLKVDYTLSVKEVYWTALWSHLSLTHRLELLELIQDCDGRPLDNSILASNLQHVYASGPSHAYYQRVGPLRIRIKGCQDTVVSKTRNFASSSISETIDAFLDWMVDNPRDRYVDGMPWINAAVLTLCQSQVAETWLCTDFPSIEDYWRFMLAEASKRSDLVALQQQAISAATDFNIPVGRKAARITEAFRSLCDRCLIIFENQKIGLAPACAKVGDLLVVPLGADVPYLLRAKDSDTFSLVGPCYVLGLMTGDLILGPLPTEWEAFYVPDMARGTGAGFRNIKTEEEVFYDPRVADLPMPDDWEIVQRNLKAVLHGKDGRTLGSFFRNLTTGEETEEDPRLTAEAIEARGVRLRDFDIV